MDHNLNLNQNYAECIKSVSSFGHTVYQNICNGQSVTVEWGGLDWFIAIVSSIVGIGFAIGVLIIFIGFAFMLLSDFR